MKRFVLMFVLLFVLVIFSACGVLAPPVEGALSFEARIVRTDVSAPTHDSYGRPLELPEYPVVIKSTDDIATYLEFHSVQVFGWSGEAILAPLFSSYTEEFFADRFLVIVTSEESSGSNRLSVDAVLENGDIHVTRIRPGIGDIFTTDMANWHIILELSNDTAPEQFNLIIIDTVRETYG